MKLKALFSRYRIFLATPNIDQVVALTGISDIAKAAEALRAEGLQAVVIHHGPKGAYVHDGSLMHHVPSTAGEIVDVTGAGDAATAGLVAGLVQGLSLPAAAGLGQQAAARVIASKFSTLVAS